MGRKTAAKTDNFQAIRSLDQVNAALCEIADLKRKIEAENLVMNEKIDALKSETEKAIAPNSNRIAALEKGMQMFCELNEEVHFKTARSINLNHGAVGFRKSTKLETVKPEGQKKKPTWAQVIALLEKKGEGYAQAVRITKSANKDVMNEWTDEKLAEVHVERKSNDSWWYETVEIEVTAAPEGEGK